MHNVSYGALLITVLLITDSGMPGGALGRIQEAALPELILSAIGIPLLLHLGYAN